ncbi:MAG: site-specific integrase [Desulfovibrio sp.]|nr:site-specific integrase [Desulfovibrio sp.]
MVKPYVSLKAKLRSSSKMPVETTKRGKKVIYGKVTVNGRTRTMICATKKEAKLWEDKMRANPEWAHPKEESTILTTLSWASQYLDAMRLRGIADSTYDEKRDAFATLFAEGSEVLHDTPVEMITVRVAYDCLKARRQTGSGYAANKVRKNLSAAWKWGTKYLGLAKDNPFAEVEKFPEVRKPRYVPSVEDFMAVYSAALTAQDQLMLLAFLDTAARKSELFNLRWEDVDLANARLLLRTKKRSGGNLELDWIPMSKRLLAMMREHARSPLGEYVFMWFDMAGQPRPYKHRLHWLRTLCRRAGVKAFDIHAIRHLSATLQVKGGLSLMAVQGMLRHRSATTTNRYLHQLTGVQAALDTVFRQEELPI